MKRAIPFIGVFALAVALAPPASATSGTLYITSDTTLTEDHYGSIEIVADNVTLDCAGYSVIGPDQPAGIELNFHSGVTIENCHVTGFDWVGFALWSASNDQLIDNSATNNTNGFAIVVGSTDNILKGDVARDNAVQGFAFETDADNNVLLDSQAIHNGGNGVNVYFSDGNRISGNSFIDNGQQGIGFDHSNASTIAGNTVSGSIVGINLPSSENNLVTKNAISGNSQEAISLWNSRSNDVVGNTISGNNQNGISILNFSLDNELADNIISDNKQNGIFVSNSYDNELVGNTSEANDTGLFVTNGSSGNVVRGNKFLNNGPEGWGVFLVGASDNRFIGNIARGNQFEGFAIAYASSGNRLLRNVSQANQAEGISIYFGSETNVIRANVTTGNANSGVLVYQSNSNLIEDNRAILNNTNLLGNGAGISVVQGSSDNSILENVACRNGHVDAYDDHSGTNNTWEANQFCTSDI